MSGIVDLLSAPFSRETLESLKRRDLQAICKRHNVKSAGKVIRMMIKSELNELCLECRAD